MALELTKDRFAEETAKGVVLIDFFAVWCGPCQEMGPIVDSLAADYGNTVKFFKVDVDKEPELAAKFGIMSIPTIVILKDGEIKDQIVGLVGRATIEAMIQKARV